MRLEQGRRGRRNEEEKEFLPTWRPLSASDRASHSSPCHWPLACTRLSIGLGLLKSQDGHRPLASVQPMASSRRGLRRSSGSTWREKEERGEVWRENERKNKELGHEDETLLD